MSKMADDTKCSHGVEFDKHCIECRLQISYIRLESLKGNPRRSAGHERAMHEYDIRLLNSMLKQGKRTL